MDARIAWNTEARNVVVPLTLSFQNVAANGPCPSDKACRTLAHGQRAIFRPTPVCFPPMKTKLRLLVLLFLTLAATPAFALNATWNAAADVPVTAATYTATGTVTFALNFAPPTGTNLTVVKNTGLGFISGTFTNLAQGQAVALSFGGVSYNYVATYYGGTGNDLVLHWAEGRALAWGTNYDGRLGNGTTTSSNAPVAVDQTGVLAGRTVIAVSASDGHSLAVCVDGTVAAWGNNSEGQLGDNSTNDSTVPVAVLQTGVLAGKTVIGVSAGWYSSIAVCSDGTVAAWGHNGSGQFGNGSTTSSIVPVAGGIGGAAAGKTIVAVSAGYFYSLALASDGTALAWGGENFRGKLGNGTRLDSSVPVAVTATGVLSGKTVVSIVAGYYHSAALCSDGTLAAWGWNDRGRLGNNSVAADSIVPSAVFQTGVLAGKTPIALGIGSGHTVTLCSDGTLAVWGENFSGQFGNNSAAFSTIVPVLVNQSGVLAGKTVVGVSAGHSFSTVVCSDGTAAAWGENGNGQLGIGSNANSPLPVLVNTAALTSGERFVKTGGGPTASHTLALVATPRVPKVTTLPATSITSNGAVLNGTVNANDNSTAVSFEYGLDTTYGTTVAGTPTPLTGTSAVPVGATLAGLTPGTTYHYRVKGVNALGASVGVDRTFRSLGIDANLSALSLSSSPLSPEFASATTSYTAATTTSSLMTVTPTTVDPFATVTVNGISVPTGKPSDPVALVPGANTITVVVTAHSGAPVKTYTVTVTVTAAPPLTWTYNTASDVPVTSNGYNAAGNTASLALNFAPPVGTNLTVVRNTGPLFIGGTFSNLNQGQTLTLSFGGVSYNFVADYYGGKSGRDLVLQWKAVRALAWGNNSDGQLGNNTTTHSSIPVSVLSSGALAGKTIVQLSGGTYHSLALASDGSMAAWGYNGDGALGDNTNTDSTVPVTVLHSGLLSAKVVVQVSSGAYHCLALCSDGTAFAWGSDNNGQLGDNGPAFSSAPAPVAVNMAGVLAGKTVIQVSAGTNHSLALCSDGTLAAWGDNGSGQLGNNSTTGSSVPVAVLQTGVLAGRTVIRIAAGGEHNLVLCSDGTLVAWGSNIGGELGIGSTIGSLVPVAVNQTGILAGKTIVQIAAGQYYSLVLCSDGALAQWGWEGTINDGIITLGTVPVAVNQGGVLAGKTVTGIAAGERHSLALCADGTLAGWRYNSDGQLGDGTLNSSVAPVAVNTSALAAGERFSLVAAGPGAGHTLALAAAPPSTTSSNLTTWRQTYFPGSTATTGPGANNATPQNDGVSNLLKFATGMNPTQPGTMPGVVVKTGGTLNFTYTPSAAAVADGFTFTVQYSDTLAAGSWASDIVNQGSIGAGGSPVTATVPAGSSGHRYLRLLITAP